MDRVDIPNALQPAPDLLTGGQPTMAQIAQLAAAGAKTIVNLRAEDPATRAAEAAAAEAAGLRYVELPIAGGPGVTVESAAALGAILRDPDQRPLVIHCQSGNRVGALVALDAAAQGADVEAAVQIGRAHGMTGLEARVRQLLAG